MFYSAHLLITHGSRNPRSQTSAQTLCQNISSVLNSEEVESSSMTDSPDVADRGTSLTSHHPTRIHQVSHAVLECCEVPLEQQILNFAREARSQGLDRIQIFPLFLLPGVHVMEDLPQAVALAQQQLALQDPSFKISTLPYLGHQLQQHPEMLKNWGLDSPQTRILLSHGSRRPDSREVCEALAHKIKAIPAYWSTEPSLLQVIEQLLATGHQEIQVLLYFLFSGGMTESIEASLQELQVANPTLKLTCQSTLDQFSDFPSFIAAVLQSSAAFTQSYAEATR